MQEQFKPKQENLDINIREYKKEDAKYISELHFKANIKNWVNDFVGKTIDEYKKMYLNEFDENGNLNETGLQELLKHQKDNEGKESKYKMVVAEIQNKIVGECTYVNKGRKYNTIESFYILPEFQGSGVALQLWENVLQNFNKNKESLVKVLDHNIQAQTFYNKLGFKLNGIKKQVDQTKSGEPIYVVEMIRKADNML